jgi:hypothetical protein
MAAACRWLGRCLAVSLGVGLAAGAAYGQESVAPPATPRVVVPQAAEAPGAASAAVDRPLPEINALMREVEAQQKASLVTIKDYTYKSRSKMDELDSHGGVKKSTTELREQYWVADASVSNLLEENGRPLSGADRRKEDERVDKRIAEAKERQRARAAGETPKGGRGGYEVTFARILELGAFSNERRIAMNGRDMIVADFAGDPKAKTHNPLENAIHDLSGTVWVDERDHALVRTEGRFANDFKLGGGLVADVRKGTSFEGTWVKVNGEVWLPATFGGRGTVRIALFFNRSGVLEVTNSEYRKFKATSKILPGFSTPDAAP